MKEKLSFSLFYVGLLAAIIAMLVTAGAFRSSIEQQTEIDLREEGLLVFKAYSNLDSLEELKQFASPSLRITLISHTGEVLLETDAEKKTMESHLTRPEVVQALKTGEGHSYRPSHTLETDLYYYAKLLPDGNVLRLAVRKSSAFSVVSNVYPKLGILLLAIFLFSLLFANILSKRFVAPIKRLAEHLDSLKFPEEDLVYKEFTPFARAIKRQRDDIQREVLRLKHEQNRFNVLIENMSEGLILLDAENDVVIVNSVAREMFHAEGSFIGRNVLCFSRNIALNSAIASAVKGKKEDAEIVLLGKDIQLIASPVLVNNEVSGVIVILLDVTEKKNLSMMREKFTANASHELKTPLTSISGYAEMIENKMAKPEDVTLFASKIHSEAIRLLSLTNDILKLSELDESRGKSLTLEDVDLLGIVKEVALLLTPIAQNKNVSVKIPDKSFMLKGDKDKLFEMVYNLIGNAIRYNKENGSVEVLFDGSAIVVKDSGVGISNEHIPYIFERFYRVDKSRSKETGGTGLGLAIVKHVAELHKAKISVKSVVGEGSEFRVAF